MNKEMIEVEMQWFTSMYSLSGVTIMNKEMIEAEMQWFTLMYSMRCDNNE